MDERTGKIDEWLANRGPTMDSCVRKRTLAFVLPQRYLHELHDHHRMIYRGCNNQVWKYSQLRRRLRSIERMFQSFFNLCTETHQIDMQAS